MIMYCLQYSNYFLLKYRNYFGSQITQTSCNRIQTTFSFIPLRR